MRIRLVLLALALMLLVPASAMADGGTIGGTVYLDGQPYGDLCVDVFDNSSNDVGSDVTDGSGNYSIYIQDPGTYSVRYGDCGVGYTTTEWSYDVKIESDVDVPGTNAWLQSAGVITGRVENTASQQLEGACVVLEDQYGWQIAQTWTDYKGDYALTGVPPQDTKVRFRGCGAGNYVEQFYDEALFDHDAKTVTVQAGQTVTGINAVLTPAGRVAGHVEDANGQPLPNTCVSVAVGNYEPPTATVDAGGDYEVLGVPPGDYVVKAYGCTAGDFLEETRTGTIAAPPATTTLNFTLDRPSYVTGHVFDPDGNPLTSICITATNTDTGQQLHEQTAGPFGYYEINRIHHGTYNLTFADCHSTGDWVTATTTGVVLGDGQTLLDVDKTLRHPEPPTADPGAGDPAPGPVSRDDPPASGSSGGDAPLPVTAPAACKPPRVVGLSLAKAKKRLRAAHCTLGKVIRKRVSARARRHKVLAQRMRRGRVALTVAK